MVIKLPPGATTERSNSSFTKQLAANSQPAAAASEPLKVNVSACAGEMEKARALPAIRPVEIKEFLKFTTANSGRQLKHSLSSFYPQTIEMLNASIEATERLG